VKKTLQDVLSVNSYDSGSAQNRVRMVALEGLVQKDDGYPSLEETTGQMPNSTFLRDPLGGSTFYNETDLRVRGPFSSESGSVASG
jgi:hypothetical protein